MKAYSFSDVMAEKAMELLGGNIRAFVADCQKEDVASAMLAGCILAGIAFA